MASLREKLEDMYEVKRIKKLEKVKKYLENLEYKKYFNNNEEMVITKRNINELSKNELNNYVLYERVLFALNYIKLELVYSRYMLTFNRLCEKYTGTDDSQMSNYNNELITILKDLFVDTIKNPVGFLTIDVLFELIMVLDKDRDICVSEEILNFIQNYCNEIEDVDDTLKANYDKFYNYMTLRKLNPEYSINYLKKTYFDEDYERFSYFDGRNYGGSIKSVNKAINNYDLDDYYTLLDEEYINVLTKMI